jgi:serine/arginine repetitive matrix protein 2
LVGRGDIWLVVRSTRMFGRRRRAASNPVCPRSRQASKHRVNRFSTFTNLHQSFNNGVKANPSAATAAAQAFLAGQASSASLSTAAAATALRSLPTPPTSVADIQTKRMIRRTNSNSSMGSSVTGSVRGHPGGQLERKGSSGSMTERTFRDPSPNRGSLSLNLRGAPPVPAIPGNMMPTGPTKLPRRAASVELPATRVASAPATASGSGSSLAPAHGAQPPRRSGLGQMVPSLSTVQELTGLDRPESRGSVNFSYPTSSELSPYRQRQLTSTTTQSANHNPAPTPRHNLVYDPNTRSFLPETEVLFYKQYFQDVADRPVKKKKKPTAAGTHLAEGTIGDRIRGTAVDSTNAAARPTQQTESLESSPASASIKTPPRKSKPRDSAEKGQDQYPTPDSDSDSSGNDKHVNMGVGTTLSKRPSIVREERELEEAEDDTSKFLSRQAALSRLESGISEDRSVSPSPLPRPGLRSGRRRGKVIGPTTQAAGPQQARSASQPAPSIMEDTNNVASSEPRTGPTSPVFNKTMRVQSVSPMRSAHFLAAPESLVTRHQPPPRSVSPRKSAMKHSPSPRDGSPIGDASTSHSVSHGQSLGDISDTSTAMSDERITSRKKSVRVSFDDESNVVLGQSDTSPSNDSPIQSASQRRNLFTGTGRERSRDYGNADDLDDETMQPRPALPSFGSVREKRDRGMEERPLVKPTKPTKPPSSRSISTTSTDEPSEHFAGHSSDRAIGAVLSLDQASRNAANTSKSREPLPPEVTSVEGSGYVSDNDSSVSSLEPLAHWDTVELARVNDPLIPDQNPTSLPTGYDDEKPSGKANGNGNIPSLTIIQATPTLELSDGKTEWLSVPGEFPSSDSSQDDVSVNVADYPTPALGISEPSPVVHSVSPHASTSVTTENVNHSLPITDLETDSDGDSIYSDAAEELSEGDGFMSLDAVVESPIPLGVPELALTTPESPTIKISKGKDQTKSRSPQDFCEPDKSEGWDKAREYWGSLTVEKKRELERAARKEMDDGVSEEEKPKPRQKRVMARPPDKDLQPPQSKPPRDQDRMYMITPGTKADTDLRAPILKPSLRATPASTLNSGHMRKSMRASSEVPPAAQPKAFLQKKSRPVPLPAPVSPNPAQSKMYNRDVLTVTAPPAARQSIPGSAPTLRRSGSGDSESSFKRARPATIGYSMKRSMRGTTEQSQSSEGAASTLRARRFSLRSLSPTGLRPLNSAAPSVGLGQKTMRRGQIFPNQSGTPTLRSTLPERTKSPLYVPGFGKSKPGPKARALPARSSRFADSSDEEDARPSFRSRFVDSSDDEDNVPALRSVIPTSLKGSQHARAVDGDSSDLPDSDDEKPSGLPKGAKSASSPSASAKDNAPASGSLQRSGSGRGYMGSTITTSVSAGTTFRSENKRRGSIMSILRRKKPDASSKVRKSELESAARRDTPLERSRLDLLAVKRQDTDFSTGSGPASPRLQKRRGLKRVENENWPLQQPGAGVTDDEPPKTADGPEANSSAPNEAGHHTSGTAAASMPDVGDQPTDASGLASVDLAAVLPPKKRKRFQMLRRAFGLDD